MSQRHLTIAYCYENHQIAQQIEQQLQPAGYQFQHIVSTKDVVEAPLFERLEAVKGNVLLLVSDNFFKSTGCMAGGLRFYQNNAARLFSVVTDGISVNEETGESVVVPTLFERVSDIIQYINFWQDRYLDIRRQKRHLEGEGIDEDRFNAHLKIMRDISSEVGEFLRLLRGAEYVALEDLQRANYAPFFRFTGDESNMRDFAPPTVQDATDVQLPAQPVVEPAPEPELEQTAPIYEPVPGPTEQQVVDREEEPIAEQKQDTPETPEPVQPEDPETPLAEEEPAEWQEPEPAQDPEAAQAAVLSIVAESTQLAALGRKEENLALLTQAIADYPHALELRYPYAIALVEQTDDFGEATNQLTLLLEMQPNHADALFLLGELAEMRGDFLAAKTYYERLAAASPDHADGHFRLGTVLAGHFPDKSAEALAHFQKAVQLNPAQAEAHYQIGLMTAETSSPETAEAAFRKTLELQSDHPFAWYDLALLYHRRSDAEGAYNAYHRAVVNNPELKTPQNDMAFEYHRAARNAKASEIIEKEQSALEEMRENLNRLELLLREREEELEQLAAKALPNQTVLITGATAGIGRATATVFAENGYRLILTGRRQERLAEVKAALEAEFEVEVHTLAFDVRDSAAVQQALDSLEPEWKQVDILINNAGKAKGFDSIHEGHLEHWEEMIDTNVKGLLYLTRAIAPQMVARRSGHIINLGSTAGKETYPKGNVYCASKFAVDALTKSMRLDLYTHNIRVSQVSPGHVEETEFALVRFDGDAARAKIYEDFKPLTSRDVADAIFFIASRPAHVNIQDVLMLGTQQASNVFIDRSGRHE
jgi:NADP-dependent 3-hydroxy acid dehydrogenase YdfG/Flp pilus assembly protein TadD